MSKAVRAVAAPGSPAAPASVAWWDRESYWMIALVFAATLLAYLPVLSAGFIWDDAGHVTRADLRSLTGLGRIWFELGATQQYYPVLHSAFWFEYHVWGDAAGAYHLLNILLHATAACLFARVLRTLAIPGAWIAALLFALHPVAVESVAWIAEQKNTLSTVFYLLAALAYLRFDRERRPGSYAVASAWFVAALGTKTVCATLPAALLVIFWWRRGRLELRRDVLPVLPWFALGAAAGAVTSWVERTMIGAAGADFNLDLVQRSLLAGRVICFYLAKLLWPVDLMFVYPRWNVDPGAVWQFAFPILVVALLTGVWLARRRGVLAGLLFFIGSLVPALGFVNVYPFIFSFVADHFQYLADFGIWALVGAGTAALFRRTPAWAGGAAIAGVACLLGALTWHQTAMYHDVFTLYQTTLAKNPDAWMAENNLAIALADAGRGQEAIPHYEAALRIRKNYPEGENNLGYELTTLGNPAAAVPHLERAIKLQPNYPEAHNNLGIALMALGRVDEGRAQFETAMRLRPNYPEAHLNFGLALARAGHTAEAITHFTQAVKLRPEYAEAELNWAIGLTLTDQYEEAFRHYRRAIELNPELPAAHNMYGRALARAGRFDDAVSQYRTALDLDPNFAEAHLNLALALRQLGRNDEAGQELQQARQLGAGAPP